MENEIMYIKLDDIIPNRFQPREVFNEEALAKLADSIRQHGVIEPILVRPISNKYEIIAGERRYKASVLAGLTKIPAIVKQMDDKESSIVAYIENEHRSNVSAIEEARTIDRILKSNNMTQEELAKELGINQSTIANKLRLLTLPSEIQDSLLHGEISERHARSLLSIKNEKEQVEMLNKIKNQKMTVRELDSEIKRMNGNVENTNNNLNNENQDSFLNNYSNSFLNQENQNNTAPVNEMPVEETMDNDFLSFLNSYDNSASSNLSNSPVENKKPETLDQSEPQDDELAGILNRTENASIPEISPVPPLDNVLPQEPTNVESPQDNDFMSFLNSYDTNNSSDTSNVIPEPQDDELAGILNRTESNNLNMDTSVQKDEISNESQNEASGIGFMSYLNNYDNNNPLPSMEDTKDFGSSELNLSEYLNDGQELNSLDNNYESQFNKNVMLNDVTPTITTPLDANSYVENSDNYVDISKSNVISSVDEIINRLKVVVDDIKENSQYKIDTDEINYDDIYQITIKIDKRDF